MRFPYLTSLLFAAHAVLTTTAPAGEILPPDRPIPEVVNHYIDHFLSAIGKTPAPQAHEATVLRRTTLDLHGRIPAAAEVQQYLESTDPAKREQLVDRLMAEPGFIRHQVNQFDTMLMYDSGGNLRIYLQFAFENDLGWDAIFRDMLIAEYPQTAQEKEGEKKEETEEEKARRQATEFLARRVKDTDKLTTDVSSIFFGVNISCAQCHDHPLVEDWKQDHYYGMKSFFNRTFENGGFVAERDYGDLQFKTTAGEQKDANLMFLSGLVLDEPEIKEPTDDEKKQEKEDLKQLADKKLPPPQPEYSRRAQLVEVSLKPEENQFFARAIVNRVWYQLFGYGLVMPLDQMHSENPSSHPELLEWLARDFVDHGYNVPRLIRGLVLSDLYARSSEWTEEERPSQHLFAVANVRPLTPFQLGASLRIASTDPENFAGEITVEQRTERLEQTARSGEGLQGLFEMPQGGTFQVSVQEALLFSNNERIMRDLLNDGGGRLVNRLNQIEDTDQAIETAVWTVLSRAPDQEELDALRAYVQQRREDRKLEAYQQIVWALMTSPEFRFNY